MILECPNCPNVFEWNGTDMNARIRCPKRSGGCGERFYIKNHIVMNGTLNGTKEKKKPKITVVETRWDASNVSILRTFYYFLTGKNDRGPKIELIEKIELELERLKYEK